MRDIDDILLFRGDISPFLVHLTKMSGETASSQILRQILDHCALIAGTSRVSDIQYGGFTNNLLEDQVREFFSAACLTETPLSEIHCLLEINSRQINLEPYGVVFLKNNLQTRGVSPVCYLNNESANKDSVVQALYSLIESHPEEAKQILPLFSVFGQKIRHPGARTAPVGDVDFCWEREWRYPASNGNFNFTFEDIFVGLCPHNEIEDFEASYQPLRFIDPRRPMKWYATKLIEARHRSNLRHSVV